jgi:TRAP-type C4-dicarboxylate transport system permease small subunit
MKSVKEKVDYFVEIALAFLLSLMTLNVLWQVFSRFILANPSSFTEELARYLLIWLGILGAAYVTGKKMHLAIDYFVNKLGSKGQKYLKTFIYLLVFSFALFIMLVGGTNLVSITLHLRQTTSTLGIQLGYVYLIVPISGLLIMYYSFYNIYELLKS